MEKPELMLNAGHADLTVIILTFNEELNLPSALQSVLGWAKEVFVLDSFSTDRTKELALEAGAKVFERKFDNYGSQRAHAITHLPVETEWILFLDADEQVPEEMRCEISRVLAGKPGENGFFCRFRLIWMGKWIRRGYYGAWLMRLFRRSKATMEARSVNEHLVVEPPHGYLETDLIHDDKKGLASWIEKHERYAAAEAALLFEGEQEGHLEGRLLGTPTERKRWVKARVWNRLPPLVRPWMYFGYRTFLQGGILDGKEALAYHTLQGLWFQTLVDLKFLEMKAARKKQR